MYKHVQHVISSFAKKKKNILPLGDIIRLLSTKWGKKIWYFGQLLTVD